MELTTILFTILLVCTEQMVKAVEDGDILDFGVCPISHPYAFQSGQACCSEQSTWTQWTQTFCNGDAIYCDTFSCEDQHTCSLACPPSVPGCWSKGTLSIKSLSPYYDGEYSFSEAPSSDIYLEANRPIFFGEKEVEGKCLWWHYQYRHWWIGPCDNVGQNAGFAYIQKDVTCLVECKIDGADGIDYCTSVEQWRRGGSDEIIFNVKMKKYYSVVASAGGSEVAETTSYVGINAVIQDGTRYKQSCRFRYVQGKFVCVTKTGNIQG